MKSRKSNRKGPQWIDSRLELFVDDYLIDRTRGVRLVLQRPIDAGRMIDFNQPWEGRHSLVLCFIEEQGKFRIYYRAGMYGSKTPFHLCCAESTDGVHWTKPNLGIHTFAGKKRNNITYLEDHFFCFKDKNPGEPPRRRYKGLNYVRANSGAVGVGTLISSDGLRWKRWRREPVITGGPLDTMTTAMWDSRRGHYLGYTRNWVTTEKGFAIPPELDAHPEKYHLWYKQPNRVRAITWMTSKDFLNWSPQEWVVYNEGTPIEHLYTNSIAPYFRAPHIQTAFPMRYVPDRSIIPGWEGSAPARSHGCSDAVFMSSRDGLHWDRRFLEAFIRPGLDQGNWTDRNLIIAPGVIRTGPGEMSVYYTGHYGHDDCHMRRGVLRLDGFVSASADYRGGELLTKPLVFSGKELVINYSTSAVGSIRVEIRDGEGHPIKGFSLRDAAETVGDRIEGLVFWKDSPDVSSLAGVPVRLRFALKDADLYAIRFRE